MKTRLIAAIVAAAFVFTPLEISYLQSDCKFLTGFTQCGIGIAAPIYNKVGQNLRPQGPDRPDDKESLELVALMTAPAEVVTPSSPSGKRELQFAESSVPDKVAEELGKVEPGKGGNTNGAPPAAGGERLSTPTPRWTIGPSGNLEVVDSDATPPAAAKAGFTQAEVELWRQYEAPEDRLAEAIRQVTNVAAGLRPMTSLPALDVADIPSNSMVVLPAKLVTGETNVADLFMLPEIAKRFKEKGATLVIDGATPVQQTVLAGWLGDDVRFINTAPEDTLRQKEEKQAELLKLAGELEISNANIYYLASVIQGDVYAGEIDGITFRQFIEPSRETRQYLSLARLLKQVTATTSNQAIYALLEFVTMPELVPQLDRLHEFLNRAYTEAA